MRPNITLISTAVNAAKALTAAGQEFEMENEKNDMIQEATGDAMDDAFADDEDEEEEDRIVNEVLDQIGVDLTGSVRHLNKNHGYY